MAANPFSLMDTDNAAATAVKPGDPALVAAMREPVFNLPRYCVKMNIQSQADKPKKEKTANPMCSMPYIIQQPMKANTEEKTPKNLRLISEVNQLMVVDDPTNHEILHGYNTHKKFRVYNCFGQQLYYVAEEFSVCMRIFCGKSRAFTLHLTNPNLEEVIRMISPFRCCGGGHCCGGGCCCPRCRCCTLNVKVESPVGVLAGNVKRKQGCIGLRYDIIDKEGKAKYFIREPKFAATGSVFSKEHGYIIYSYEHEEEVGRIRQQFHGVQKTSHFLTDHCGISFPLNLDPKLKATLLGCLFLIKYTVFDQGIITLDYM